MIFSRLSSIEVRPKTAISEVNEDQINIRGFSLPELMGKVSFTEAAFLIITSRLPSPSELRMFDALLVTMIDHGIATQVFAARWTIAHAPESLQGAMASAILGVGNQFGGVCESVGQMVSEGVADARRSGKKIDDIAAAIVEHFGETRLKIPGLGHGTHKEEDPRARRLFEIAKKEGFFGAHSTLMFAIRDAAEKKFGRTLVVNAMGAIGALVVDLGLDWKIAKGLVVVSKTPGILAHVHEEMYRPIVWPTIWKQIEQSVEYDGKESENLNEDAKDSAA